MAELLEVLKERFENHPHRHPDLTWQWVAEQLSENAELLSSVKWMEETGGEPDVFVGEGFDGPVYVDFAAESPQGRRSWCYDGEARLNRKKNAPSSSAVEEAEDHGLSLLNENQYRSLQSVETLDAKTSSWILTDASVREKGGAFFCDRRYGRVFLYHNGADSYYGSRGFRGYVAL